MRSSGSSKTPPTATTATAGAAATGAATGGTGASTAAGSAADGKSRSSALSPLPSALRVMGDDLLGEFEITLAAARLRVVEQDGLAVTRRFGQAHVSGNDAREDLGAEEVAQVGQNLAGKVGALVVHGEQDPFDGELRIERAPDAHQGVEQLAHPFQGQVLALDGNQDRIGRAQGVEGEQVQGGRAVENDEGVSAAQGLECALQAKLPLFSLDKLDRGSHQVLF